METVFKMPILAYSGMNFGSILLTVAPFIVHGRRAEIIRLLLLLDALTS